MGRLRSWKRVEVLWTRQAALGEVGHVRQHFRGRVRAEIAVLHLTRLQVVLCRVEVKSQLKIQFQQAKYTYELTSSFAILSFSSSTSDRTALIR